MKTNRTSANGSAPRAAKQEPKRTSEPDASGVVELKINRERNRSRLESLPGSAPELARKSAPDLVNPAVAAIRAADALSLLRWKANEAGALALLLSDAVKLKIRDHDGWNDFDGVPGFGDGLYSLAHSAAFRLSGVVDEWERNLQPVITRLRAEKPFARPARVSYETGEALLAAAGIESAPGLRIGLEEAVRAMNEIILLFAKALDERAGTNYFAARFTVVALEEAFDTLRNPEIELRQDAIALLSSQGAGQRQAA